MSESALNLTPKRKRGNNVDTALFTPSSLPQGCKSPRSRMAHKFGSLVLEAGLPAEHGSNGGLDQEDTNSHRKRARLVTIESPFGFTENSLSNCHSSSSSRRKRAGTPPLVFRKAGATAGSDMANEALGGDYGSPGAARAVEPLRASLTWHEHEITVYDPEDSDDDATGLNGIGFKPTAAIAQARALVRMQQLAKYRQAEEVEARDRRRQRRHEIPPESVSFAETERTAASRKVRFMESQMVIQSC